jgi:hypothetical protein
VIGRFRDRSFLGAALTRGSALRLRLPRKLITGPYASFAASAQARLSSCMIKCTPTWLRAGFAQDGLSTAELEKMIAGSTFWIQTPDARRILWGFAAALLDDKRLVELWVRIEEREEWDVLRRALKSEAERRGLPAPRKPEVEKRAGH